jgi:hypothetical protein
VTSTVTQKGKTDPLWSCSHLSAVSILHTNSLREWPPNLWISPELFTRGNFSLLFSALPYPTTHSEPQTLIELSTTLLSTLSTLQYRVFWTDFDFLNIALKYCLSWWLRFWHPSNLHLRRVPHLAHWLRFWHPSNLHLRREPHLTHSNHHPVSRASSCDTETDGNLLRWTPYGKGWQRRSEGSGKCS